MGKRVHNAKARQNPTTIVDNSSAKAIQLDLDARSTATNSGTGYDEANALVLPSQKRATKIKVEQRHHVKILSKKQRKHLQSIVDKKKKKEGRAELLEALATVQIPQTELSQYTSLSQVQTIGVKKLQSLDEYMAKKQRRQESERKTSAPSGKISSMKGAGKRRLLREDEEELEAKRKNPNVVGLDADDDTDEDSESEASEDDNEEESEGESATEAVTEKPREEMVVEETPPTKAEPAPAKLQPPPAAKEEKPALPPRRTVFVPVHRDPDIQAARLKLPILAEEQQVMETINENSIIIVAGETGSGKTTQIPQFLYESGYAQNNKLIGITEPRRVAAIAMSKRVAHEMSLSEREVSYLIRFEGNVTPETRIKFMTDGVLLKEIESDFLLTNYSVIILDEAHERSAYTDILVGLLSRIVPLRVKRGNPLKLIIMSATLRVEDFVGNTRLFRSPPPLLKVEARQFPVTMHFQKHTPVNYVEEAYRKVVKIHSRLPEGGILVFVTGQQEVNVLVRKLRRAFPYTKPEPAQDAAESKPSPAETADSEPAKAQENDDGNDSDRDAEFDMKRAIRNVRQSKRKFMAQIALPKINLDDYKLPGDDTEADLAELDNSEGDGDSLGEEEDDDLDDDEEEEEDANEAELAESMTVTKQPLWVLPLYSLLSTDKQNRIFQPPPEGTRFCVVSTNIAETSLTIPNIKYVVDSGRQKTRLYDKITGVSAFVVTYTSKASAGQRAGRAGRVSAGHCYRLYSSAVYNDEFEDFATPDIQKKPVDDLMLQMRCMGIDRVINFPFPSPPDVVQMTAAEQRLIVLGALERVADVKSTQQLPPAVTRLGEVISRFPVAPRFGKMLALSHQQKLLPYTVCLVAALSVQQVLLEYTGDQEVDDGVSAAAAGGQKWQRKRLSWAAAGNYQLLGDPMVLLRAVGGAEYAGSQGKLTQFCHDNGLRPKAIAEVRKLRVQLTNEINLNVEDADLGVDPAMAPPTDGQARFMRQILLAGMADRVARKVPLGDISDKTEKRRLKYAYNCLDMEAPVHVHANSVLRHKLPEWIVYQEAYELAGPPTGGDGDEGGVSAGGAAGGKMFIRGITAIEPEWLLLYAPVLCNIVTVREDPAPRYNEADGRVYAFAEATFGRAAWELPLTEMEMPLSEKACCYFGLFLLDGRVCPQLAAFKPKMKSAPSAIVKSWSNLNESVMRFKRALIMNQINTREKLFERWEKKSEFLLEEYQNLLYNVTLAELSTIWPPKEGVATGTAPAL